MKIANVKGLAVKATLGAVAMGAVFFAGTEKAQAQWAVGVQLGAPAYAPVQAYYAAPGYSDRYDRDAYLRHEQREAMERREAYLRREQWEHAREFNGRAYDRDRRFDRDGRAYDRDDRDARRWR